MTMIAKSGPEVSVVIPVYNSANIFPSLYERIVRTLESAGTSFEIICILDGCRDNSLQVVSAVAATDGRVKAIDFSRNFGHQTAVTAGLDHASGAFVAVIDDDLEDPPELLAAFLAKLREGYDVVYGVRRKRKRSVLLRLLYPLFYRTLGALVDINIPYDAGDFCAMTNRVANVLRSMREHNRYLRGMRAWAGFRQTGIEYEREPRFADETGYDLMKYFSLALNAVFSFSYKPLKYVTLTGVIVAAISFEEAFRIIILNLTGRISDVPGWSYLAVALLFLSGVQLISMGIIGEYLARMYDELKKRPHYVVSSMIGFEERRSHDELA